MIKQYKIYLNFFKNFDRKNIYSFLLTLCLAFLSAFSDYFILKIISGDININANTNIVFIIIIPFIKFFYLRSLHITPALLVSYLNKNIFKSFLLDNKTYKALFKKLQISTGQEMDNIESLFIKSIIEITYSVTSLILIFIASLDLISKDSFSGIIFLILFYMICTFFSKKYVNNASLEATSYLAKIDRLINYSSYGRDLINIHKAENKFINSFYQLDKKRRLIMSYLNIIGQLPRQILELLICLAIIFYIFLESNLLNTNAILGLSFAGFKLLSNIQSIFASNTNIRFGYQIFIQKLNIININSSNNNINNIRLRNSNFWSRKTISNKNIDIYPGDKLFVSGISGSGKTTLLKEIGKSLRDYKNVFNNDFININFRLKNLSVSYCPQENILLKGTIYDQIKLFGNKVQKKKLNKILEICCLDKLIYDENTLNYEVDNLSGGERRRLLLAITLYRDTEVFIFDEPSSGIEMNTFSKILNNIDKNFSKKIFIYTTHEEWGLNWYNKKILIE